MSCGRARARLSRFVDRDLPQPESRAVADHLAACAACSAELSALQRALRALQELPRQAPSGSVAAAVMHRIEVERRGPGLQLLFRPFWKARPLMLPSLLHGAFVFAVVLAGALALERHAGPAALVGLAAGAAEVRWPASGTEANPMFPSAVVAVPRLRDRATVPDGLLFSPGEGSVFLETVVARDGSVSAVTLIDGDSAEAQALAAALRLERFEPTRVDGRPVAVSLYRLFSRMEVRAHQT